MGEEKRETKDLKKKPSVIGQFCFPFIQRKPFQLNGKHSSFKKGNFYALRKNLLRLFSSQFKVLYFRWSAIGTMKGVNKYQLKENVIWLR